MTKQQFLNSLENLPILPKKVKNKLIKLYKTPILKKLPSQNNCFSHKNLFVFRQNRKISIINTLKRKPDFQLALNRKTHLLATKHTQNSNQFENE